MSHDFSGRVEVAVTMLNGVEKPTCDMFAVSHSN